MIPVQNKVTKKMWDKGLTVSEWARQNGFNAHTVFCLLSGKGPYTGKRGAVGKAIHEALIRDGYIRPSKSLLRELGMDESKISDEGVRT